MKKNFVSSLANSVGPLWRDMQNSVTETRNFLVAAPLSSTPLPMYRWIIEHANTFNHFEKLKFVLMDEMLEANKPPFLYVQVTDAASYEGFAKRNFLDQLQEKTGEQIEIMKPDLSRLADFTVQIDLLILALGVKGNFANVMPGTSENTGWHIAHLIPEFRQVHTQKGSGSYEGAIFREYGMSMGPQQVIDSKQIAMIISGEKKRELTKELLSYTSFVPEFPLSIVHHPLVRSKVSLFITPDAM